MFCLHIVFILIVIFHVLSLVVGFKYGHLKAFDATRFDFENGYSVEVERVVFVNHPDILKSKEKHSKIRLSNENFSINENHAMISLYKNEKLIAEGNTYFLKPFVYDNIRITIENFFLEENNNNQSIGIRLVVSRNPVLFPFFLMYAIAILLLLMWTILTWRRLEMR